MIPLLRAFSLTFLALHFALYFPSLADVWFVVLATGMGFILAYSLKAWRTIWSAVLVAAIPLVVRILSSLVVMLVTGEKADSLDQFPLWLDRQLAFATIPYALAWGTTTALVAIPTFIRWERLVNSLILTLLFWLQGPYHVTLYPHPLPFALAVGGYLISEGLVLYLAGRHPSKRRTSSLKGRRDRLRLSLLGLGTGLMILVTLGLLWSLFARYEEGSVKSNGGLMKPDLFQFDFSQLIKLESEISMGDDLVLLYREEGPPQKRYLRRFVLSGYAPDSGFFVQPGPGREDEVVPSLGKHTVHFPGTLNLKEREIIQQEYYLVNLDPSSLIALNAPSEVIPYAKWDQSSYVAAYRATSAVSTNPLWELDTLTDTGLSPEMLRYYTSYGNDSRIKALAEKITAGSVTPFEKAAAVMNYLKDNYLYSLKPGIAPDGNQLNHFLFETKKGYCSYFAFSMALLLRSVGVPSRVSVGFFTNPQEGMLNFYPVRAFQAHAWVEVPFGPFGWLDFDPTSEKPAPGEEFSFPKGMNPEDLSKMIAEILNAQPTPLQEKEEKQNEKTPEDNWIQRGAEHLSHYGLWYILGLFVFAMVAFRFRHRIWYLFTRDSRKKTEILWRELRMVSREAGYIYSPEETPLEFARRTPTGVEPFVRIFLRARYAPEFSADDLELAREALLQAKISRVHLTPFGRRLLVSGLPFLSVFRWKPAKKRPPS